MQLSLCGGDRRTAAASGILIAIDRRTEPGSPVPIRMAPLESASLLSDLRREPHTIGVEIDVDGAVEIDVLRRAAAIAVARHPMARVTAAASWLRPMTWTLHDTLDAPIVEHRWDAGAMPCAALVDIGRSPFELHVMPSAGGPTVLHVAVNHAAFDGIGAVRLVRSILSASNGADDPVPAVDPIAVRGAAPTPPGGAGGRVSRPGPPSVSHMAHRRGRAGAWVAARTTPVPASGHGVTVNDLLHVAFHTAAAEAIGPQAQRVRTLMPVNARPSAWAAEVVGNHAWLEQIDTVPGDRLTLRAAREAVSAQTAVIRTAPHPDRLFELLGARWMPPGLGRVGFHAGARLRRAVAATGTVSNLGLVAQMPDFAGRPVSALRFSPPCRAPRGVALGAVGYAGRLHLTLRMLRQVGELADADRFLDRVITALHDAATPETERKL
jgi:NRPS condensation-like uncharacterized protein